MARQEAILFEPNLKNTVAKAVREKQATRIPDGGGLTLVVNAAGKATWIHRYAFRGRTPERTLGTYPGTGLADARALRNADRALIAKEKNPVEVHANDDFIGVPTFGEFCRKHFKRLAPPSQRSLPMERSQWFRDMTEVVGHIANLPVDDVRVTDVERVVKPMWKGEVATPKAVRIASAIARVMDHRLALERPNADPDANDWARTLMKRLRKRVGDDKHHTKHRPALRFDLAPEVFKNIRALEAMSARCLEFIVATGVRAQEAAGATWGEFYWDGTMAGRHSMTWTVPACRRKSQRNKGEAGEPFVVPVSMAMLRCLNRARRNRAHDLGADDLCFPSYGCNLNIPVRKAAGRGVRGAWRDGGATPFTNQGILEITLKFGERGTITTHGFRSTLAAWGAAVPHRRHEAFTDELMDKVLGHGVAKKKESSAVSQALPAYLRQGVEDPYLDRRRVVLMEWSAYLNGRAPLVRPGGRLVPFPKNERPALRLVA
jgi:integrase